MENQNGVMTKAETMDIRMNTYGEGITSTEIFEIIHQIFNFDLQSNPNLPTLPQAAIDEYLEQSENKVTGAEIRKIINQTAGINLDALSALEGAKISLYSKDQWMLQHNKDLFVVHTGTGDIDARILPTDYFTEQTGSGELPIDLIHVLLSLGFYYEENLGCYYYSNPTGEPVPDAFKGQTIMAIRKVIQQSYSHL